jgi:hypothetical protein
MMANRMSQLGLSIRAGCNAALRETICTTHNATHNRSDLQVVERTYAAVRNLQVVECAGQPQTEKAGVGGSTPSLATIILKDLSEIWRPEAGRITHGRSPTPTG